MTEKGIPTDINALPDGEIKEIIVACKGTAALHLKWASEAREESGPLKRRLADLQREAYKDICAARALDQQAQNLQALLQQRREARDKEGAVTALLGKLGRDAEEFSKSPAPIAQGLSRVLGTISQDSELRNGLANLIDPSSSSPSRLAGRVKIQTDDGDSTSVQMDANGGYMVAYHLKPQTPGEISKAIANIHAKTEDPYIIGTSLRVDRFFLGLIPEIQTQTDPSIVVSPVVLLRGKKRYWEFQIAPHAEELARPVADFVGDILGTGTVSLSRPPRTPQRP